jgi:hypothetical protein
MEIKGRNLIEGVPKTLTIDDSEIREALGECVATIVNAIRVALERTPPELSADISDRGIVLTGGGGLLKNLDKRIREETGLPVSIADDPLASAVRAQLGGNVRMAGTAFENHMFQQMRHTAFAGPFLARTDEVGYVYRDVGFGAVRENQHAQAVIEAIFCDPFHRSDEVHPARKRSCGLSQRSDLRECNGKREGAKQSHFQSACPFLGGRFE